MRLAKFLAIGVGFSLSLAFGLAAFAQAPGVPSVYENPITGLEQITVQNTGPYLAQVQLRQVRDSVGFVKSAATSGTLTFAVGQSLLQLSSGSTIASLTVALTAAPANGQQNCIYTKSTITALTLSVASGQTLNDAITAGVALTRYCYLYSTSNTTWDRVQ